MTSRRDYLHLYAKGRRVRSNTLTLFCLPNTLGRPRVGLTVTRKLGGAVRRNAAKRRLREIFRLHADAFGALDVVVNAHPRMLESSYADVERDLLDAARRARRALRPAP